MAKRMDNGDKKAIGFSLIALTLLLFLFIAFKIYNNSYFVSDGDILGLIGNLRNSILTPLMLFFTYLGEWWMILLLVLASLAVLLKKKMKKESISLLISVIGGEAITWSLKKLIHRARPDVLTHLVIEKDFSFPSGHSFVAITFFGFLAYLMFKKAKKKSMKVLTVIASLLVILGIGLSRIYLGVHWPSDVLGSYLLGVAWITSIILYLETRKK